MSSGNLGETPATTSRSRPGARTVAAWLITCLAAFAALAGWSLASPAGSSPDDDYHLASIWCAQGLSLIHI